MSTVIIVGDGHEMTPQDKGFLRQVFKGEIPDRGPCEWCGGLHQRECRRVRRMVYHPSGERVTEVEFWPDGQWDETAIVWPEDCF